MPVSEEKTTAYQATESERAIIGAILRGDILPRNIELTIEDFTDLICHEVFAVMQKLDAQNKACDLVTVSDAMPNFDSMLLVELLQSGMPSLVLCDQYVANVKAASMRRALCKIAQQTVELSRDELTDPVKAAEEIRGQIDWAAGRCAGRRNSRQQAVHHRRTAIRWKIGVGAVYRHQRGTVGKACPVCIA